MIAADGHRGSAPLWIDPEYHEVFDRHGLRTLDDLFELVEARRMDKASLPGWRERLAIELDTGAGGRRRFFVKRFCAPPGRVQRRRILAGHGRRSTAGVERYWIEGMRADGLPVPRVAAFGEEIEGARESRSALVLADVGGVSLERWAADRAEPAPPGMERALAELIAAFHRCGYVHRDLYLSHVFLVEEGPSAWRFALIDLQRVMRNPLRRMRWQARDLAQLHYSTPPAVAGVRARLRFLRTYLGGSLRGRAVRGLIRRIERKASRIARHDARRRGFAAGEGRQS